MDSVNQFPTGSGLGTEHSPWAEGPHRSQTAARLHASAEWVPENLSHALGRPQGLATKGSVHGQCGAEARGRGGEAQTLRRSQITGGAGTQPCSPSNTWHPNKGLASAGQAGSLRDHPIPPQSSEATIVRRLFMGPDPQGKTAAADLY